MQHDQLGRELREIKNALRWLIIATRVVLEDDSLEECRRQEREYVERVLARGHPDVSDE
jgi:hypothetical protein